MPKLLPSQTLKQQVFGAPSLAQFALIMILSWFTWIVFDALKDLPIVHKGCEEMLCVS